MHFVNAVKADNKGRTRIENRRAGFLELTSHRAQGLIVVLQVYWTRLGIQVTLVGMEISIILRTTRVEKVHDRALME